MKLNSFSFKESFEQGWEIGPIFFQNINLLVGGSGAGKSRTMNALFNIGRYIASNMLIQSAVECQICFGDDQFEYKWEIKTQKNDTDDFCPVIYESLQKTDLTNNQTQEIICREQDKNLYNNAQLPKLDPYSSYIYVLREEEDLKPVISLFKHIVKRNFFDNSLSQGMAYQNIPHQLVQEFSETKNVYTLLTKDTTINGILYLLKQYDQQKYNAIIESFKDVFENVKECGVSSIPHPSFAPNLSPNEPIVSFWIKEKHVDQKIYSQEMSTGMQKVLMIITDMIALPEEVIYLVDEYENSLGVNAIDFLPSLLIDYAKGKQILITTHHPYLINKIPIRNWLLINRQGSKVSAIMGNKLAESYGNSRQESFMQLINDPRYTMEAI